MMIRTESHGAYMHHYSNILCMAKCHSGVHVCTHVVPGCTYWLYLYTDDYTRVKLNEIQEEEGSDYINASYLDVRYYWSIHHHR